MKERKNLLVEEMEELLEVVVVEDEIVSVTVSASEVATDTASVHQVSCSVFL